MKVALITASSAGLGAAIARAMVFDMKIILNYSSNESRVKVLVEELLSIASQSNNSNEAQGPPRVVAFRADIGKRPDIENLVSSAIRTYGRLDVVVSNGGWTRIRNFNDLDDNLDEDDWDQCFNINVKSHLWLMKAVMQHLEATEGAFVTVASVAGVKPSGSSVVRSLISMCRKSVPKTLLMYLFANSHML
jgi:NAD(P)-dependent dehydrogenase (short-subunit alcohol dehydrogenase family)